MLLEKNESSFVRLKDDVTSVQQPAVAKHLAVQVALVCPQRKVRLVFRKNGCPSGLCRGNKF